jgi:hypothetical protein
MPMRGTRPDDGDDRRQQVTLLLIIGILAVWAGAAAVVLAACLLGARADRTARRHSPTISRLAPVATTAHGRTRRIRLVRV